MSVPLSVISPVISEPDIRTVEQLGRQIWTDHYVPIIGSKQVEYMLDKFQSFDAISAQIADQDFWYFLIQYQASPVGYIGLQREADTLFLSTIYIMDSARGKGLARKGVDFSCQFARDHEMSKLELTVNRNNTAAIAAYEQMGFTRTGQQVTDIGEGYVMDDFVFELAVF